MNVWARVEIRENFNSLGLWKPITFSSVERATQYEVIPDCDSIKIENNCLRISSNNSASGMVFKKEIEIHQKPRIQWRWNVQSLLKDSDVHSKEGDDFSIRVLILFKYDPDSASFMESIKYAAAKKIYGEYPPHSSIGYVWTSSTLENQSIQSPYNDQSWSIPIQKGEEFLNSWIVESRNIVEDYKMLFGKSPPMKATIAIMGDSDNTGQQSMAFIDYISVQYEK